MYFFEFAHCQVRHSMETSCCCGIFFGLIRGWGGRMPFLYLVQSCLDRIIPSAIFCLSSFFSNYHHNVGCSILAGHARVDNTGEKYHVCVNKHGQSASVRGEKARKEVETVPTNLRSIVFVRWAISSAWCQAIACDR